MPPPPLASRNYFADAEHANMSYVLFGHGDGGGRRSPQHSVKSGFPLAKPEGSNQRPPKRERRFSPWPQVLTTAFLDPLAVTHRTLQSALAKAVANR